MFHGKFPCSDLEPRINIKRAKFLWLMFCKYLQALQVPGILTGCNKWQTGFKHSLYIFFFCFSFEFPSTFLEGKRAHFIVSEFVAHSKHWSLLLTAVCRQCFHSSLQTSALGSSHKFLELSSAAAMSVLSSQISQHHCEVSKHWYMEKEHSICQKVSMLICSTRQTIWALQM